MSRDFRKKGDYVDSKVITFSIVGVVLLAAVVFGILMYGRNVDNNVRNGQLSDEQIASIKENDEQDIQNVIHSVQHSPRCPDECPRSIRPDRP